MKNLRSKANIDNANSQCGPVLVIYFYDIVTDCAVSQNSVTLQSVDSGQDSFSLGLGQINKVESSCNQGIFQTIN